MILKRKLSINVNKTKASVTNTTRVIFTECPNPITTVKLNYKELMILDTDIDVNIKYI